MKYSKYKQNNSSSNDSSDPLPEQYQEVIEQMIPDALMLVQDVLCNDEYKAADRLRAAQLIGKWYGLENPEKFKTTASVDLKDYLNNISKN